MSTRPFSNSRVDFDGKTFYSADYTPSFGRAYDIEINGEPFIKSSGGKMLRVVFDILVVPGGADSFADIRIYNLKKDTVLTNGQTITFRAGYENANDAIFIGRITNIIKERSGADIATRLLCWTGTSFNDRGSASSSYGPGAKIVDVLFDLARSWPRYLEIDESQFSNSPTFTSGFVAEGDIPQILDALAYQFDFTWISERGRIVINKNGAERKTYIYAINQYTGMRGIPEVSRGPNGLGVTVRTSLNPYIRSNSRIQVESEYSTFNTGNLFIQELSGDVSANGNYNVHAINYRGDSHGDVWDLEIEGLRTGTSPTPEVSIPPGTKNAEGKEISNGKLIWGSRVDQPFRVKVREISKDLSLDPNWIMAVIAFESDETFSPSAKNPISTATGLIQFIESTAKRLGTTTKALSAMSAVQQLDYVKAYYAGFNGRIKNIGDAYMAVLWPVAVGKPDTYVLWTTSGKYQTEYNRNSGLDVNRNGEITRAEAISRVNAAFLKGQQYVK